MKVIILSVSLALLLIVTATGQQSGTPSSTTPAQPQTPVDPAHNPRLQLTAGTTISAELTKPLDAKKSKVGDPVEARVREDVLQQGQIVIRRGTRLVGRVMEAQTKGKGREASELAIMLEHAVLAGGETVPLSVAIQAAAAPPRQTGVTDLALPGSATGEPMGRSVGQIQKTPDNADSVGGDVSRNIGYLQGRSMLSASSKGVFGLEGVGLKNAIMADGVHSTFMSREGNLHLESGTQLILRVLSQ